VRRILEGARFSALVAIVGLASTMVATLAWSIAKSIKLFAHLLDGGWRDDLTIVELLEAIDTYLLGIVQLIVVIGLYELFVGPLNVPAWLKASSLDDLKKSIVDVLIVFIAVKGIERLLAAGDPLDTLAFTGAVAVLIVALSLYRLRPGRPGASRRGS
jgi:uncharacterized membrane protein YqhA